MGLVLAMSSWAWASVRPRGSASWARFWRLVSRFLMESSEPTKTMMESRPSSVLPMSTTLTRGDFAARAR